MNKLPWSVPRTLRVEVGQELRVGQELQAGRIVRNDIGLSRQALGHLTAVVLALVLRSKDALLGSGSFNCCGLLVHVQVVWGVV